MAVKYAHLVRWFDEQVWAILPGKFMAIRDALAYLASGGTYSEAEIQAIVGASRRAQPQRKSVAVLPMVGTIAYRAGLINEGSGGMSIETFRNQFRELMDDGSVTAIVLDVDSPGGAVDGVEEMAEEIYQARKSKPVVAVANTMAASAAYWLASAASELYVTPSGQVGSIGVFAAHEDQSGLMEQMGIKTTLVSAGKYKVEGNPYEPLSDEARAYVQKRVDESYAVFTRTVARNRGVDVATVREGFGEGRVIGAREAVKLGMVDGIASLDETVSRLTSGRGSDAGKAPAKIEEPSAAKIEEPVMNGEALRVQLEILKLEV